MESTKLSFKESSKHNELDIDLNRYWLAVKRRWLPATAASIVTLVLTALALSQQESSYDATGKILIRPDETPSLTGLDTERADLEPLTIQSNPLKTEIEILLSRPLLEKAVLEADVRNESGNLKSVSSVQGSFDIEVASGTDILEITYSGSEPEQAANIVNILMELYIENNIRLNQAEAIAAREFIARELPKAEAAVEKAELELSKFKEANQLVDIEEESQSAVELVAVLDRQLAETKALLDSTNAQLVGVRQKVNMTLEQATDISAISQAEGVRELLTELQAVESQLASESTFFQDSSPQIEDLESRRSALQELLRQRIRRVVGSNQPIPDRNLQVGEFEQNLIDNFANLEIQRLGLSNQLASLQQSRTSYVNRISNLPRLEREQRDLQRRLNAVQVTYENLLTRLQEVQAVENQFLGNARIIENASVPEEAALNKKGIALGLGGLLFSFVVFGLIVLALEVQDPYLKTVEDIRRAFKFKTLEIIPSVRTVRPIKTIAPWSDGSNQHSWEIPHISDPNSSVSEVYRMLQVNLQSKELGKLTHCLVVSSAVPGEGKSTVAANLAVATAELGESVLLIDANLRRPSLHKIWDLPNINGLHGVLKDESDFETSVHSINHNLSVLTAGGSVPSPLTLLKSQKMSQLLHLASQKYSWVLIDTPPILLAPDALRLSNISDGMILVSRLGYLDPNSTDAVQEILEKTNQKVLGMVINDASKDSEYINRLDFIEEYHSEQNNQYPTTTYPVSLK